MAKRGPKGLIESVPERPEFVRRVVSEREFDYYESHGWARVKASDGDRFKETFTDPAAGRQFAMEIPTEDYQKFSYQCQGGQENEKIRESLNRVVKDKEHGLPGEERVTVEERRLPPQARVRRDAK